MSLVSRAKKRKNLMIIGAGFVVLVLFAGMILQLSWYEVQSNIKEVKVNGYVANKSGFQYGGWESTKHDPNNEWGEKTVVYDHDEDDSADPDVIFLVEDPVHGYAVLASDGRDVSYYEDNSDMSKYSDQVVKNFYVLNDPSENKSEEYDIIQQVFDRHFYGFYVVFQTNGDKTSHKISLSTGIPGFDVDALQWEVEAGATDGADHLHNDDEEWQKGPVSCSISFDVLIDLWDYQVNPDWEHFDESKVQNPENYSAQDFGVWAGILGVRTYTVEGGAVDGDWQQAEVAGWKKLHAGTWDWPVVGENVEISTDYYGFKTTTDQSSPDGWPDLPTTVRCQISGVELYNGLFGFKDSKGTADWYKELAIQNVYVKYVCVMDVLLAHGFQLVSNPSGTGGGIGGGGGENKTEQGESFWDQITSPAHWAHGWMQNRWAEAKSVGGFVGDIFQGLFAVLMILILIVPVLIFILVLAYAYSKLRGKRK